MHTSCCPYWGNASAIGASWGLHNKYLHWVVLIWCTTISHCVISLNFENKSLTRLEIWTKEICECSTWENSGKIGEKKQDSNGNELCAFPNMQRLAGRFSRDLFTKALSQSVSYTNCLFVRGKWWVNKLVMRGWVSKFRTGFGIDHWFSYGTSVLFWLDQQPSAKNIKFIGSWLAICINTFVNCTIEI